MNMPDIGQSLTPTENVGRCFNLHSTLPALWAVYQPHQVEVPAQGNMPGKKPGNHPGLLTLNTGAPIGSRYQFSILSLGITKFLPSFLVLVPQPATNFITEILLRDPQGQLRPYKPSGRAAPREPVSCFIASHHCVPDDPKKSHRMPGRHII
jgi:hypothetical protein